MPTWFGWAAIGLSMLLPFPLAGCAAPSLSPEQSACLARMNGLAEQLQPAFSALGFRPKVFLLLDEEIRDGRGFRKSDNVLADASPSGRIRLRPSAVCSGDVLGWAVVAHEMAHVALQHIGTVSSGVVLAWDKPPAQETEADELAYKVLSKTPGAESSAVVVSCRLGRCGGFAARPGRPRQSAGAIEEP